MPQLGPGSSTPAGRNSFSLTNASRLKGSPGRLTMLEFQGNQPLTVDFDPVMKGGDFSDTTFAGYAQHADKSLTKFLRNDFAKRIPVFFKGELTHKYEGVSPKKIQFDIIYRADFDLPPEIIKDRVMTLQSMCYPRSAVGLNPPLCMLYILNLYALEVYVEQVVVNWHNTWATQPYLSENSYGLPMGCDISVTCLMHQYPTRDEILCGAGFDSTNFLTKGYSGNFQDVFPTLTHENDCVQRLLNQDHAYRQSTITAADAFKAAKEAEAQARKNQENLSQPAPGNTP